MMRKTLVAALGASLSLTMFGVAAADHAPGTTVHYSTVNGNGIAVMSQGCGATTVPAGTSLRCGARIVAASPYTAPSMTIAVRSPSGAVVDFTSSSNVAVGTTIQSFEPPAKAFTEVGTYTYWLAYTNAAGWVNEPPTLTFTVTAASTSPVPGKSLAWDGSNFNDSTKWVVGRSSAYPNMGPTNPGDSKLDHIAAGNAPSGGVFTADRRSDGNWNTDLVTTEGLSNGFEVRPGDSVVTRVTLRNDQGAWPAIWTWGRDLPTGTQPGHGEVDLFEYHPSSDPDMLELSNHTKGTGAYKHNLVTPGTPFDLRVDFGLTSVDWYVNGTLVYADGAGVPSNWQAWLIVNLSVSSGTWHAAPSASQTHMEYAVNGLRVYR